MGLQSVLESANDTVAMPRVNNKNYVDGGLLFALNRCAIPRAVSQ
jgi:hypothetical protein